MTGTLIDQGLELMLFGMGTVLVFLTLLVFATLLMSGLLARFAPPEPVAVVQPGARPAPAIDDTLLAVITAAIHQHRSRRSK